MSLPAPTRRSGGPAARDGVRLVPAAAAALALAVGGCDEGRPPGVLPDATYIAVMARLGVVLEAENADPEAYAFDPDSARGEILAAYVVSSEDLGRYAAHFGDDPDHMHEVWSAIADSARALRERWTTEEGMLELPQDAGRRGDEGGDAPAAAHPGPGEGVGPDTSAPTTPDSAAGAGGAP